MKISFFSVIKFMIWLLLLFPIAGDSQTAVTILKQRLIHLKDTDPVKLQVLSEIISSYKQDLDSVTKYANTGLNLAMMQRSWERATVFSLKLADIQMNNRQYDNALHTLDRPLEIGNRLNDQYLLATVYRIKGIIYFKFRKYKQATEYLFRSIRINESIGNSIDIPICYSMLGFINVENYGNNKGLQYQLKAFSLIDALSKNIKKYTPEEKNRLDESYITICAELAGNYHFIGDLKKALYYYNIGLTRSIDPVYIDSYLNLLVYSSDIYFQIGDKNRAIKLAQESRGLAAKYHLWKNEVNALLYLGRFSDRKNESLNYYNQGIKIACKNKSPIALMNLSWDKDDKAKKFGDYKTAVFVRDDSQLLKDSLASIEKSVKIADLESIFNLDKATLKVKGLEIISYQSQVRDHQYLLGVIILFVFILVFYIYYDRLLKLNKALEVKTAELEELNEFKDKVFFILGHDMRGTMSGMAAIMHILDRDGLSDTERKNFFQRLKALRDSSFETLNKLLLWGSMSVFEGMSNKSLINIPNALDGVINLVKDMACAKQVELVTDIQGQANIRGNLENLEFIIRNLLNNAVKFSNPGSVVNFKMKASVEEGFVEFEVKNFGAGIPEKDIPLIFSGRLQSIAGTAKEKGSGLGLMLCKKIANLEKYTLSVNSIPDKYTTFSLTVSL